MGRALGASRDHLSTLSEKKACKHLRNTTSVFHWEYLSQGLTGAALKDTGVLKSRGASAEEDLQGELSKRLLSDPPVPTPEPEPVNWSPPDLRPGGTWHSNRVTNLMRVVRKYYGGDITVLNHGLDCLAKHRLNYDCKGPNPTALQVL